MVTSVAISVEVTLTSVNCGKCGGTYAINERYRQRQEENAGTWNCPYCQVGWGYVESELSKVQKRLEDEKRRHLLTLSRVNEVTASLNATKALATRHANKLKRVQAGVCPECNRSFQNLKRHMQTKHHHCEEKT